MAVQNRYLLYVDILGFEHLVRREPACVPELYRILDSLHAHRHHAFTTIAFSDTILVYSNDDLVDSDRAREYFVMYSCEFAQDLLYRLIGTDLAFRAVLTFGEFDRYHLTHMECFYGRALIDSYQREKAIKCTGLFIDRTCQQHNRIYPVARYDDDLSYVFLNQATQRLQDSSGGVLPMTEGWVVRESDDDYCIAQELIWLNEVYERASNHPDPDVRLKYLTTWNFQLQRYPELLHALVRANFDPNIITKVVNWQDTMAKVRQAAIARDLRCKGSPTQ